MRNLKGPPATSEARPTTSEGAWAFFFQIMPPCRQYIFNISFAIVEIKKCANLLEAKGIYGLLDPRELIRPICGRGKNVFSPSHGNEATLYGPWKVEVASLHFAFSQQ